MPKPHQMRPESKPGGTGPASSLETTRQKKTTKPRDVQFSSPLTRWLFENQFGLTLNIISLLGLAHRLGPEWASRFASRFVALSYFNPRTGLYAAGHYDLCFLAFAVVVLTCLRAGLMEHVLSPLARTLGAPGAKERTRFAEQGYMFMYYGLFWPLGLYLYAKSPSFLDMKELWTNWPQRELSGLAKAYMLVQWAYWIQQVLVVNMEVRRKDYWQMIVHHAVTISLICASYYYHHTRVGTLILVLMDVSELIFPLAKCLKCTGYTKCCDIAFGAFVVTWLVARHALCLAVCWSIYADLPGIIPEACFRGGADALEGPLPVPRQGWAHLLEPFLNPRDGRVCQPSAITTAFLAYLLLMQAIIAVWSYYMIGVAVKVLRGSNADDIRSDDEDDLDEESAHEEDLVRPHPGPQAAAAAAKRQIPRPLPAHASERAAGGASGFSLHRHRQELLNRIGCEKQID